MGITSAIVTNIEGIGGYTDPLIFAIPIAIVVIVIVIVVSASKIDSQQRRIRNEDRLLDTLERIRQENALPADTEELVGSEAKELPADDQSAALGRMLGDSVPFSNNPMGLVASSPEKVPVSGEGFVGVNKEETPAEAFAEREEAFFEDIDDDDFEEEDDEPQKPVGAYCDPDGLCFFPLPGQTLGEARYIAQAKRDGTYEEGVTEAEATEKFGEGTPGAAEVEALLREYNEGEREEPSFDEPEADEAAADEEFLAEGVSEEPQEDTEVDEASLESEETEESEPAEETEDVAVTEESLVETETESEESEESEEAADGEESLEETSEDQADLDESEEEELVEADETEETEAAEDIEETEEIEKPESKTSRLRRLKERLAGKGKFGRAILGVLSHADLEETDWEAIEDELLAADFGVEATTEIIDKLKTKQKVAGTKNAKEVRRMAKRMIGDFLDRHADREIHLEVPEDTEGSTAGILMVGVNGGGKTTTVGKLARLLVAEHKSVVLGAADTFRAAAGEQLETWGKRVGVPVIRSEKDKADPASVAFDAAKEARETGADVVLIDTAGRLQNKSGLMDELGKIKRVAEKQVPITEVLLVIDATTGQNALSQAKIFTEAVGVTGIVLTKLDGSAKGGVIVPLQRELGIPVKLVGLGEGPDDLAPFVPADFADALLDA